MKEGANAFSAEIMGFKCHPSKKIIVFIMQKLSNLFKLSKMQLVYTTCTKLCFLCPLSASIVCNNNNLLCICSINVSQCYMAIFNSFVSQWCLGGKTYNNFDLKINWNHGNNF